MIITCKNCENTFEGRHCNECGQQAETHDINSRFVLHEIQHGVLHFDKGILYTARQLFTRPGHAIREFIEGKRVKHSRPIAFVFILLTLYVLLTHFLKVQTDIEKSAAKLTAIKDAQKNNYITTLVNLDNWFKDHYALSVLLTIPLFASASFLAFRKSNNNYFKNLVLSCYITGQTTIVYILLIPVLIFFPDIHQIIAAIISFSLATWTYVQFFNKNSVFKNILLSLLTYAYFYIMFEVLLVVIDIVGEILKHNI